MLYAQVVLPLAQPAYTFSFEETMDIQTGDAVVVQFGAKRYYTGIVWSTTSTKPTFSRIKPIIKKLYTTPLLDNNGQRLWEWLAEYYMCTLGEVMRMALPSLAKPSATTLDDLMERRLEPRRERYIALAEPLRSSEAFEAYAQAHAKRAPQRIATLRMIRDIAQRRKATDGFVPRRRISVDAARLKEMLNKEVIVEELRCTTLGTHNIDDEFLLPTLSPAQQRALEATHQTLDEGRVALLHGVTGSGKTAIYEHLIAETLTSGRDVLLLVPEIVITSQLIERLERIFDSLTTTYHSRLTPLRRGQTYLRLAASTGGELVVGVRSALFLPLRHLGLVIVDEEHDASYKQSERPPLYNGRDCAIYLAHLYGARVVLGSATPSMESYANALSGKYGYVPLMERWGESRMPEIIISDTLRAVKRNERKVHFNTDLLQNINRSLEASEQVILFQNRRGYAPYIQCSTCGYSPRCPQCNVTLTQHKASARMECHYCGYSVERPTICPACQTQDIRSMGFGTEKVEEEISRLYPEADVARLDGDTSSSESAFRRIVHNFEEGNTDILVGTQIVTKGFDFGGVTTVGILNADNLLSAPDFRASERAFQLMMQVAGRAGRRNDRGRVVIQTSQPTHPVIRYVATGDYSAMANAELQEREKFGYPPYSHLVRFSLRHRNYETLRNASHDLAQALRQKFGQRVMGPASSAIEMIRGEHRAEIMLKVERRASFALARKMVREAMAKWGEEHRSITTIIDVDAW